MTFEADAAIQTDGDILSTLTKWVERIRAYTARVDTLTLELEQAKEELNRLVLVQVPDAMQEAGLTDITLDDGSKLVVKSDVKVSINEANRAAAFSWLRRYGHDMAVKNVLEVDLRPLPSDERAKILTMLDRQYHAEPTINESIHHSTLKSIVAGMLENGATIPECISVFQFRKALLKERK
jgi:GH24 family phage-related lysozyme (muramidase)